MNKILVFLCIVGLSSLARAALSGETFSVKGWQADLAYGNFPVIWGKQTRIAIHSLRAFDYEVDSCCHMALICQGIKVIGADQNNRVEETNFNFGHGTVNFVGRKEQQVPAERRLIGENYTARFIASELARANLRAVFLKLRLNVCRLFAHSELMNLNGYAERGALPDVSYGYFGGDSSSFWMPTKGRSWQGSIDGKPRALCRYGDINSSLSYGQRSGSFFRLIGAGALGVSAQADCSPEEARCIDRQAQRKEGQRDGTVSEPPIKRRFFVMLVCFVASIRVAYISGDAMYEDRGVKSAAFYICALLLGLLGLSIFLMNVYPATWSWWL